MRHLSQQEIEEIAHRLLTMYCNLPEHRNKRFYKVDPEIMVKNVLGLNIGYERLSLQGDILGLTAFEEVGIEVYDDYGRGHMYMLDGNTVLVEKSLKYSRKQVGRCNFSLLHEGSHQVFKMLYPNEYGDSYDEPVTIHPYKCGSERRGPIKDWEEWQANSLAAAILLPPTVIEQGMYFFGMERRIQKLDHISDPYTFEKFSNLATFLGSSKQVLAFRMKRLGLLREDYLDRN